MKRGTWRRKAMVVILLIHKTYLVMINTVVGKSHSAGPNDTALTWKSAAIHHLY